MIIFSYIIYLSIKSQISMVPSLFPIKNTPGLVGLHSPDVKLTVDKGEIKRGPSYYTYIMH